MTGSEFIDVARYYNFPSFLLSINVILIVFTGSKSALTALPFHSNGCQCGFTVGRATCCFDPDFINLNKTTRLEDFGVG